MDPKYHGVWSTSEINMVKSIIASRITEKTYPNDTSMKHTDIIDELHERFPCKEKLQVIALYVELAGEMMKVKQNNNYHVVGSNALVNDNLGTPREVGPNMEILRGYQTNRLEPMKMVEQQLHNLNGAPQKHTPWSQKEQRNFLRGLEVHGRGSWKKISKNFVPTKTPVQICSHAQKYFQRNKSTTRKQRFSINDIGLYDPKPLVQNDCSSWEALAFASSADNTNSYDFDAQEVALNHLAQASQVGCNQVATWTRDQQMTTSSSLPSAMMQNNSPSLEALTFTSTGYNTNYHAGLHNLAHTNHTSSNQLASRPGGHQTTTISSVASVMVQNNSPCCEALAFAGSSYNPNNNIFDGQQVALNNIALASQVSSRQVANCTTGHTTSSSFVAPAMEGAGSHQATYINHQQGDFAHDQWMDMDYMY